ncbi:hypothetical protein A9Q96_11570 [Rhodobacterales bacterium 52_120_T64]|nr:hypothetical protein A9Q96_11570 [Rhodobacterales bacterium 52_120_T64]
MNTKKLVLTALTVALLCGGTAFAKNNGNSNGNSENSSGNSGDNGNHGNEGNNGNNGNDGNNGNGAIASELKWRNAAHASAQAFLNANPDSAVGKLATLRDATLAAASAYAAAGVDPADPLRDPADIQADIDAISGAGGLIEAAEAEIALLDIASDTYGADLVTLTGTIAALEEDVLVLEAELALPDVPEVQAEIEAKAVVGVEELSEEALAALWDLLNK